MDVFVVQRNRASNTGNGVPIGVYVSLIQAQQSADGDAPAAVGKTTHTISEQTADEVEMRVHLIDGKSVGTHAIFRFALNEAE